MQQQPQLNCTWLEPPTKTRERPGGGAADLCQGWTTDAGQGAYVPHSLLTEFVILFLLSTWRLKQVP